jgi:hypothetical protein
VALAQLGRRKVRQGAFLVERENVAGESAYNELRGQLGAMMDQVLRTRTNLEALKMPMKEKPARNKRKDRQASSR